MDIACKGCGRKEIHKMCPAWGTPIYCDENHPEWGKATDERLAELRKEEEKKHGISNPHSNAQRTQQAQ